LPVQDLTVQEPSIEQVVHELHRDRREVPA
jgi:hypothetical protein